MRGLKRKKLSRSVTVVMTGYQAAERVMTKIKMGLTGLTMMSFVALSTEADLFCSPRCLLLAWLELCYRISAACQGGRG